MERWKGWTGRRNGDGHTEWKEGWKGCRDRRDGWTDGMEGGTERTEVEK